MIREVALLCPGYRGVVYTDRDARAYNQQRYTERDFFRLPAELLRGAERQVAVTWSRYPDPNEIELPATLLRVIAAHQLDPYVDVEVRWLVGGRMALVVPLFGQDGALVLYEEDPGYVYYGQASEDESLRKALRREAYNRTWAGGLGPPY